MALCWCALVITFAVFFPFLTAAGFIDTPGNVTVHVGESVILQCSIDSKNFKEAMIMYWYKTTISGGFFVTYGQSVWAVQNLFGAERYSLDTSNVGGVFTYNLRITNAEVADSGQYQCRATDEDGTRRAEPGSLTVVVQETNNETMSCSVYPEAPTLGQTVTFSCIAPRGISPDMLTWMDGTFQIIQPEANLANEHGISFVKTLAEADNFAEFTCLVGSSFSTTRKGMNCSVTPLAVPIRAEVTPSVLNAVIAGNATFRCRGTAIPSVQRYRWLYGSGNSTIESNGRFSVVNNGDSSTFTITRLTAEDNSMMVRCVVQNAVTKTFDLAELHVSTTRMEFTSQQKTSPAAQTLEVSSLSTTIATETKTEHTSGTFSSAELHLSTTQIPTQQPTTPAAKTDEGLFTQYYDRQKPRQNIRD
ncbi:basement membrane-specific heparan sulfate proteoglycan core protein-like [Asterias rubens]|uniref:basement membrane-specific heparan sulfate proteoglycan core protein-like n=1 Tax=Asterias rubens TaxID=7604 RepID=UPI0014553704|nr:basement membrane-specific heparan sulfate proteoglycan core protein-like [Asterias rubens]